MTTDRDCPVQPCCVSPLVSGWSRMPPVICRRHALPTMLPSLDHLPAVPKSFVRSWGSIHSAAVKFSSSNSCWFGISNRKDHQYASQSGSKAFRMPRPRERAIRFRSLRSWLTPQASLPKGTSFSSRAASDHCQPHLQRHAASKNTVFI